MVRSLLETLYDEVYWIDPTITRLPRWSDLHRSTQASEHRAAEPLLPKLTVFRPGSFPVEPLPIINRINDAYVWRNIKSQISSLEIDESWDIGIGRPSRLALWAMRALSPRARFMDVMDDFPAFYRGISRYSMERIQGDLARRCDYLFCSQQSLIEKLALYAPETPIRLIPNGYDMRRLPNFFSIKPEKEIIGFVGTIAAWFDWKLVIEMAQALPNICVQLIGPRAGYIPTNLPENIELLPACTVEEAIVYCQNFNVGLIPFVNNQLTTSVDPIKYYELRALGIPIWTTAFGSMVNRIGEPGVSKIQSGIDWKKLWNEKSNDGVVKSDMSVFRNNNDWSERFKSMPIWLDLAASNIDEHEIDTK